MSNTNIWIVLINWLYIVLQQILFLGIGVALIWGGFFIRSHGFGLEQPAEKAAKPTKEKGRYKRYFWLYSGMWLTGTYLIIYQVIFSIISAILSGGGQSSGSGSTGY